MKISAVLSAIMLITIFNIYPQAKKDIKQSRKQIIKQPLTISEAASAINSCLLKSAAEYWEYFSKRDKDTSIHMDLTLTKEKPFEIELTSDNAATDNGFNPVVVNDSYNSFSVSGKIKIRMELKNQKIMTQGDRLVFTSNWNAEYVKYEVSVINCGKMWYAGHYLVNGNKVEFDDCTIIYDEKGQLGKFNEGSVCSLNGNKYVYYINAGWKSEDDNLLSYAGNLKKGKFLYSNKQYSEAVNYFSRAIELDTVNFDPYILRGQCEYILTDKVAACQDWEKASKLGSFEAKHMLDLYCK
jgi:tetratricopeptide (TPR) repeat protein